MVFNVHIRMAKTAATELQAQDLKIWRKLYIFGNIFPDLIIPHTPVHRKELSQEFFDRMHSKISNRRRRNAMRIHVWDSFLLGVLSHYAADYSCTAHKQDYNENMRAHMRHEKALSRFLKDHPDLLTTHSTCPICKEPCRAAQFGTKRTETLSDELIEAMDAIRMVCGSAVLAAA